MKKQFTLFLAALLICNMLAAPARAEESQPTDHSEPTSATQATKPSAPAPTESAPATEATQPGDPAPDTTIVPTETTEPKPCNHVYGEWTADEAAHGRKCTLCGYAESNGHTWAAETVTVAPTCKDGGGSAKVCIVCQLILITELIPPTTTHTYDNGCDAVCNVCSAEREVTHSYNTVWTYSYKGHWHKCTICGAAGELKSHYPGPAATEEKDQICLTCGYIMTKKLNHNHKWKAEWSSDENAHWYACSSCTEKKENSEHTFDDACDQDCNICGYIREANHRYGIWMGDESGHWQECETCGAKTPPEMHEPQQNGVSEPQCVVCLHQMTSEHVHEFAEEWKQDDASHWKECACGERTEAGEHSWDEGTEQDGMQTFVCEVCQAEKQEEIPAKAFPWLLAATGGVVVLCLAGIAACVVVIRRNKEDER